MEIRDIMNRNITEIRLGSTMRQAAEILSHSWASDLMVVDDEGCFIGVLSEGDLIRAVLPKLDQLVVSSDSPLIEGFTVFDEQSRDAASKPIDPYVIRNPITYAPGDDVLKAAAKMVARQIRRMPVVEDGRLVGTVARSDICLAAFAW